MNVWKIRQEFFMDLNSQEKGLALPSKKKMEKLAKGNGPKALIGWTVASVSNLATW